MANPQAENGHIDIANEIADKLCSYRLNGQEWQIVWVILRKTWGWLEDPKAKQGVKKKMDRISLSQFEKFTGINRHRCHSLLKGLVEKRIIKKTVTQKCNTISISYGFQKDYDKWKMLPKSVTVTQKCNGVLPKNVTEVLPKNVTEVLPKNVNTKETITKETITKETITKEKEPKVNFPDWLPLDLWNEFKKYRKKIKKPLSPFAEKLNITKLKKLKDTGEDPVAIIEETIMRGWQGFFPLKDKKGVNDDKYNF